MSSQDSQDPLVVNELLSKLSTIQLENDKLRDELGKSGRSLPPSVPSSPPSSATPHDPRILTLNTQLQDAHAELERVRGMLLAQQQQNHSNSKQRSPSATAASPTHIPPHIQSELRRLEEQNALLSRENADLVSERDTLARARQRERMDQHSSPSASPAHHHVARIVELESSLAMLKQQSRVELQQALENQKQQFQFDMEQYRLALKQQEQQRSGEIERELSLARKELESVEEATRAKEHDLAALQHRLDQVREASLHPSPSQAKQMRDYDTEIAQKATELLAIKNELLLAGNGLIDLKQETQKVKDALNSEVTETRRKVQEECQSMRDSADAYAKATRDEAERMRELAKEELEKARKDIESDRAQSRKEIEQARKSWDDELTQARARLEEEKSLAHATLQNEQNAVRSACVEEIQRTEAEIQSKKDLFQTEIQSQRDRFQQEDEARKVVAKEVAELEKSLSLKLKEERDVLKQELFGIQTEIATLLTQKQQGEQALQSMFQANRQLQGQCDAKQMEVELLEAQLVEIQGRKALMESQIAQAQSEFSRLTKQIELAKEQQNALTLQHQQSRDLAQSLLHQLQSQCQEAQDTLEGLEQQIKEKHAEIHKANEVLTLGANGAPQQHMNGSPSHQSHQRTPSKGGRLSIQTGSTVQALVQKPWSPSASTVGAHHHRRAASAAMSPSPSPGGKHSRTPSKIAHIWTTPMGSPSSIAESDASLASEEFQARTDASISTLQSQITFHQAQLKAVQKEISQANLKRRAAQDELSRFEAECEAQRQKLLEGLAGLQTFLRDLSEEDSRIATYLTQHSFGDLSGWPASPSEKRKREKDAFARRETELVRKEESARQAMEQQMQAHQSQLESLRQQALSALQVELTQMTSQAEQRSFDLEKDVEEKHRTLAVLQHEITLAQSSLQELHTRVASLPQPLSQSQSASRANSRSGSRTGSRVVSRSQSASVSHAASAAPSKSSSTVSSPLIRPQQSLAKRLGIAAGVAAIGGGGMVPSSRRTGSLDLSLSSLIREVPDGEEISIEVDPAQNTTSDGVNSGNSVANHALYHGGSSSSSIEDNGIVWSNPASPKSAGRFGFNPRDPRDPASPKSGSLRSRSASSPGPPPLPKTSPPSMSGSPVNLPPALPPTQPPSAVGSPINVPATAPTQHSHGDFLALPGAASGPHSDVAPPLPKSHPPSTSGSPELHPRQSPPSSHVLGASPSSEVNSPSLVQPPQLPKSHPPSTNGSPVQHARDRQRSSSGSPASPLDLPAQHHQGLDVGVITLVDQAQTEPDSPEGPPLITPLELAQLRQALKEMTRMNTELLAQVRQAGLAPGLSRDDMMMATSLAQAAAFTGSTDNGTAESSPLPSQILMLPHSAFLSLQDLYLAKEASFQRMITRLNAELEKEQDERLVLLGSLQESVQNGLVKTLAKVQDDVESLQKQSQLSAGGGGGATVGSTSQIYQDLLALSTSVSTLVSSLQSTLGSFSHQFELLRQQRERPAFDDCIIAVNERDGQIQVLKDLLQYRTRRAATSTDGSTLGGDVSVAVDLLPEIGSIKLDDSTAGTASSSRRAPPSVQAAFSTVPRGLKSPFAVRAGNVAPAPFTPFQLPSSSFRVDSSITRPPTVVSFPAHSPSSRFVLPLDIAPTSSKSDSILAMNQSFGNTDAVIQQPLDGKDLFSSPVSVAQASLVHAAVHTPSTPAMYPHVPANPAASLLAAARSQRAAASPLSSSPSPDCRATMEADSIRQSLLRGLQLARTPQKQR